ncbi:hypothetical protein [Thauera sp. SDU_THAU2]|uniref:hypothetical protein n=1 Tax=Thauera sp. SDU_THAU2 TaxID=3136633 RepID=UPI004054B1B7
MKQSGLGREGSRHGVDEYLETKYDLPAGLKRPRHDKGGTRCPFVLALPLPVGRWAAQWLAARALRCPPGVPAPAARMTSKSAGISDAGRACHRP